MNSDHRPFGLTVQSAGMCTATGTSSETRSSLLESGPVPRAESLQEVDIAGETITALSACSFDDRSAFPSSPSSSARIAQMTKRAAIDLARESGSSIEALGRERLFIVRPESDGGIDAIRLVAHQAWLEACNVPAGVDQLAIAQLASFHDHPAAAIRAATSHLAGAGSSVHAIVLCAESWLAHASLTRLDSDDLLRTGSSSGIVPGEAAVLLRLSASTAFGITCVGADDDAVRHDRERPLGTLISELSLAAATIRSTALAGIKTVLRENHGNQRAMGRELEFVRSRNWLHLASTDKRVMIDTGGLGYIGHCGPLLHIALLADLENERLPALACSRSLWRHTFVGLRA